MHTYAQVKKYDKASVYLNRRLQSFTRCICYSTYIHTLLEYICVYASLTRVPSKRKKKKNKLYLFIAAPITFAPTNFMKTNVHYLFHTQCRHCDHAVFIRSSAGVHVNSAWSSCLQIYYILSYIQIYILSHTNIHTIGKQIVTLAYTMYIYIYMFVRSQVQL